MLIKQFPAGYLLVILVLSLSKGWQLCTANAAENLTGCSGDDVMGNKVRQTSKNED